MPKSNSSQHFGSSSIQIPYSWTIKVSGKEYFFYMTDGYAYYVTHF
jgi:hypothetical protein